MHMAFDPAPAFELLRRYYHSGLLDRLVAIADQAIDGLMKDTGLGMGDLLAMLDSVPPEAVLRAEEAAASTDLEEVAAKMEASASDPGAAAGELRACLERAVQKARADIPVYRG